MPRRSLSLALALALASCKAVEPDRPDLAAVVDEVPPDVDPARADAWLGEVYKPIQAQAEQLDPAGFAALYPEPAYLASLSYNPQKAKFLPKIAAYAGLHSAQRAVLGTNGFVAVASPKTHTFATTYLDLYVNHLPVLITSDSLLYALHRSYDSLLLAFEYSTLAPAADRMLARMHRQLATDLARLPAAQRPAADDLDVYLAVARSLLSGAAVATVSPTASDRVKAILAAVASEQPVDLELFGVVTTHDMSQLRPRGHYTEMAELRRYFQAMMWLGRAEFPLVTFDRQRKPSFNRRALEAAFLAEHLLRASQADADWNRIDDILGVLVGEHDSMTPNDMQRFRTDTGVTSPEALAQASDESLYTALMQKAYGLQRIMSQILVSDPHEPNLALPRSFLLMGQRFTIDSHILAQVSYDRLLDPRSDTKTTRMLPSELDVQFALGNNAAARHLAPDIAKYNYQGTLHELRFLVDAHPPAFWDANLYNGWLAAIRALGDRSDFARWPEAMRTAAWADKTLNTQTAAWAELRHDTLLYVKQSYSASVSCEYPDAYVEPVPGFYSRLAHMGRSGTDMLARLGQGGAAVPRAAEFFAELTKSGDMLAGIARKELAGTELGADERDFLRATIEVEMIGCGQRSYDGWYGRLFYDPSLVAEFTPTIADVHTAPTDERGNPLGMVLHAATGRPLLMVFTLQSCKGVTAYVGPVSSYHSLVTQGFVRRTDDEWAQQLDRGPVARPAWTSSFVH